MFTCIGDQLSQPKVFQGSDLTEIIVQFSFPTTVNNVRKVYSLTRHSLQCLQQCPPGGDTTLCWLNDEVRYTKQNMY